MSAAVKAARAAHEVSEEIVRLLRPLLTRDAGLKVEIVKVAGADLEAQNVAVQFRPVQAPKRGPM